MCITIQEQQHQQNSNFNCIKSLCCCVKYFNYKNLFIVKKIDLLILNFYIISSDENHKSTIIIGYLINFNFVLKDK